MASLAIYQRLSPDLVCRNVYLQDNIIINFIHESISHYWPIVGRSELEASVLSTKQTVYLTQNLTKNQR
jgi:hypothetical protein